MKLQRETILLTKDEQKAAPTAEQKKWLKCGAQLRDDLMICEGKPILPKSLHKTAALVTHGVTLHASTGGIGDIISKTLLHSKFRNFSKRICQNMHDLPKTQCTRES